MGPIQGPLSLLLILLIPSPAQAFLNPAHRLKGNAAAPSSSSLFFLHLLLPTSSIQPTGHKNETSIAASSPSCPTSCFRPDPVCGVDGITYWCGMADAACAGVEVHSKGYCSIGSGGQEGGLMTKGVLAAQSFLLLHTLWLVFAGFLVLLGLP